MIQLLEVKVNKYDSHKCDPRSTELNKTYAFDTVSFSEWLTDLRKAILEDTLDKIEKEGHE